MSADRHPQSWLESFKKHAQTLSPTDARQFEEQIGQVDWNQVAALVDAHVLGTAQEETSTDYSSMQPAEFVELPQSETDFQNLEIARKSGESLLKAGRVGVIIVAGGQGSRLGYDGPKGTYPIGAVSGASLFYFHARKVLGLTRRYGQTIPLLVMTSPENDAATRQHFEENAYFGLNPAHVRFFTQGQMPAVDKTTGEPIFAGPASLALSPDGHGGCLYALSRADHADGRSALDWASGFGVKTLFYYQVDNPMVDVADPAFLGLHHDADADVSFKVVSKQTPAEKVGVVCVDASGRKQVIEYSDLPESMANQRDESGRLAFRAGSIAVHIFETAFLKRLATGATQLPFHKALKKVAYWSPERAEQITPEVPNAIKFEAFIFDTLPMAERSMIVETDRTIEFEPLKNATGADSPETVRAAMSLAAASALSNAGIEVARDDAGKPVQTIELDPVLAIAPDLLVQKLPADWQTTDKLLVR